MTKLRTRACCALFPLGMLTACEGTGLPQTVLPRSYPAGPYGDSNPQPGAIVENLSLRGGFNPNASNAAQLAFDDYTLQDLRGTDATHALILTAAAWCPSCQTAATELGGDLEEAVREVNGAGGLVITLLLENSGRQIPSDAELRVWADRFELDVSIFGPGNARVAEVFAGREFAYVIALETMEVLFNSGPRIFAFPTVSWVGLDAIREELELPPLMLPALEPTPPPAPDGGVSALDAGLLGADAGASN